MQTMQAQDPTATPAPTHTPWGVPDSQRTLAPGVVLYTTESHGGIWISPEMHRELPVVMQAFQPWAGWGWYEEDVDSGILALAFPGLFSPAMVRASWRQAVAYAESNRAGKYEVFFKLLLHGSDLTPPWQGPARERVETLAREWEADHDGWWERGSGYSRDSDDGRSWGFFYVQVGTGKRVLRFMTSAEYVGTPQVVQELPGIPG